MRKSFALPAAAALLIALVALPAQAGTKHRAIAATATGAAITARATARQARRKCGRESRREPGYTVILDGSRKCFAQWKYAGGASATLQRDGTVQTGGGADGLGVLWFAARPYGDFSLRLQFRDDATAPARANSGVQVRFPAPKSPTPGCPTTFDGDEQDNPALGRGQLRPRGPDQRLGRRRHHRPPQDRLDLRLRRPGRRRSARVTPAGTWNDLEITVVGQHYTVNRNGVVINEYENVPGVPFPGRPNDPDSSSRGLVGYVGLQAHGGENDIVSFRNVRIRDLEVDG